MEVVHIVRQYKPSVGGLEDAVQNLCACLAHREGIKVRIVTLDRVFTAPNKKLPQHEVLDGISVTRLSYFGSSRYPIALQVLREIRSASLVHVHAIDFFFDYLALTRLLHRKPLVASTHGGFFHTSFASQLKKIYFLTITRFSARSYEALCTSSENDAVTFRRIAPSKIVTIENGVNVSKWKNCANAMLQRAMIFIGRWSENKRVSVLIDLVSVLKQQGAIWSLIIVGVPGEVTITSLNKHARRLGIESQVCVYERPSEAEIATLIGRTSYIASASCYEGFGISVIEGVSAGLVPLLSPIPPFEKLRNALGLGAVIDETKLDQSAHNIEHIHAALEMAGQAARAKCIAFARHYDWAERTDRLVDVYRKALG